MHHDFFYQPLRFGAKVTHRCRVKINYVYLESIGSVSDLRFRRHMYTCLNTIYHHPPTVTNSLCSSQSFFCPKTILAPRFCASGLAPGRIDERCTVMLA